MIPFPVRLPDKSGIRPGRKRGFKGEICAIIYQRPDPGKHQTSGFDDDIFRVERGKSPCDLVRIDKLPAMKHLRQYRVRSSCFPCAVTTGYDIQFRHLNSVSECKDTKFFACKPICQKANFCRGGAGGWIASCLAMTEGRPRGSSLRFCNDAVRLVALNPVVDSRSVENSPGMLSRMPSGMRPLDGILAVTFLWNGCGGGWRFFLPSDIPYGKNPFLPQVCDLWLCNFSSWPQVADLRQGRRRHCKCRRARGELGLESHICITAGERQRCLRRLCSRTSARSGRTRAKSSALQAVVQCSALPQVDLRL